MRHFVEHIYTSYPLNRVFFPRGQGKNTGFIALVFYGAIFELPLEAHWQCCLIRNARNRTEFGYNSRSNLARMSKSATR